MRSDDPIATATAAEMFLSKGRDEMNEITHQMIQGHLRAVISTLPLEKIHRNPEAFAQSVQTLTAEDLANMGIQVVSFTVREIRDPSGFLTALGCPQLADVQKEAVLGEASAQRDSRKGKALADRDATVTAADATREARTAEVAAELAIADAERVRDVKVREYAAQIAQAVAAPLERIDRITMVNTGGGDGAGIERITQGVTNVMAQMPGMAELLGSLNLAEVVQQFKRAAAPQADGNGRVLEEAAAPDAPSGPAGH